MRQEHQWSHGEMDTILEALTRATTSWGDQQFLDFLGETFTFRELERVSNRFGNELKRLGVNKGDTVVTFLDNSADAILTIFAVAKAGGINVPINTANRGEFLRHQVTDAGAKIIIAESEYAERLSMIADAIAGVDLVMYRGAPPDMATAKSPAFPSMRIAVPMMRRSGLRSSHQISPS